MEDNRQIENEFVWGLIDNAKFLSENIITLRNELRETIRRCKKYVDIDWEIALKIIQLERAYNELFNIHPMSFDEFKEYVLKRVEYTPKEWRYGQSVFNIIDEKFGVARDVQLFDGVDCFYKDKFVDEFLVKSYNRYLKKFE